MIVHGTPFTRKHAAVAIPEGPAPTINGPSTHLEGNRRRGDAADRLQLSTPGSSLMSLIRAAVLQETSSLNSNEAGAMIKNSREF
jgi:hypothetical protein